MEKILAFIVPVLVIGENNRPSFDRRLYNLYLISEPLEWKALFDKSALSGADVKITIKGVKILERLNRSNGGKVSRFNNEPFAIDFKYAVNGGLDSEITLDMLFSAFTRASKEEDRQGIDFYMYDIPLQLKSFTHGISEYCDNVINGTNKKRGISAVNCTLKDLEHFFDE